MLFILPWAIPEAVGAIAWMDIAHPQQGLLAQLVGGDVPWRDSPELSLLVLLLAATWMGWPLWMLVATAGLRTIPRSIHEAAAIEGAGRWRTFASVTLPLLVPLLGAAFVVRGVAAFNQFYLFYVLEPGFQTQTLRDVQLRPVQRELRTGPVLGERGDQRRDVHRARGPRGLVPPLAVAPNGWRSDEAGPWAG